MIATASSMHEQWSSQASQELIPASAMARRLEQERLGAGADRTAASSHDADQSRALAEAKQQLRDTVQAYSSCKGGSLRLPPSRRHVHDMQHVQAGDEMGMLDTTSRLVQRGAAIRMLVTACQASVLRQKLMPQDAWRLSSPSTRACSSA